MKDVIISGYPITRKESMALSGCLRGGFVRRLGLSENMTDVGWSSSGTNAIHLGFRDFI